MKYKGIIIDLDDTIYDYRKMHDVAYKNMITVCTEMTGKNFEEVEVAFKKARKATHMNLLHSAASHNRILYFHKMLEYLNEDVIIALVLYDAYWDCFLNNIVPFDDAINTLDYLKKKGYRVCLLTDLTTHIQLRKIKALNINSYVDFIVTSEEVGAEKPSTAMFLMALNKLKMKNDEVVMIGDNYSKDILGSLNLDISAIWLNSTQGSNRVDEGVIEIKKFNQLREVL